jgi:hypothetical protein
MAAVIVRVANTLEKIEELAEDIRQLVRLEEQSQGVLKQPVEQMLDSANNSLSLLEEQKTRLMRLMDRHSNELLESRVRQSSDPVLHDPACADAYQHLMLAFRSLQRIHQDNERILHLRMSLLSEDMRHVERSRQFLRATLQTVAA